MNPNVLTWLRYAGLLFILLVLQIAAAGLVSIAGVTPDFVLLGVIFIAMREGRLPATIAGFAAGLLIDLYTGDVIGISALAKTITGFAAGFSYDPELGDRLTRTSRSVMITLLCVFLHNMIYLFAYLQSIDVHILELVLLHGVGSTVYTTVLGIVPPLIRARTDKNVIMP